MIMILLHLANICFDKENSLFILKKIRNCVLSFRVQINNKKFISILKKLALHFCTFLSFSKNYLFVVSQIPLL